MQAPALPVLRYSFQRGVEQRDQAFQFLRRRICLWSSYTAIANFFQIPAAFFSLLKMRRHIQKSIRTFAVVGHELLKLLQRRKRAWNIAAAEPIELLIITHLALLGLPLRARPGIQRRGEVGHARVRSKLSGKGAVLEGGEESIYRVLSAGIAGDAFQVRLD